MGIIQPHLPHPRSNTQAAMECWKEVEHSNLIRNRLVKSGVIKSHPSSLAVLRVKEAEFDGAHLQAYRFMHDRRYPAGSDLNHLIGWGLEMRVGARQEPELNS